MSGMIYYAALFIGKVIDNARYAGTISYIQYVPNGSVFFTEEAIQEFIAKSTHRALSNANRDTYRKRRNNPK